MTPSALVLKQIRLSNERWSLAPHRNDDPPERKLALEVIERMLPARLAVGIEVNGRPVPYDEMPLTASFVRAVLAVIGMTVGWKTAYRIRREGLSLLRSCGYWHRKAKHGLVLFKPRWGSGLRLKEHAGLTGELLSAQDPCQGFTAETLRAVFGERGPP